ncbi:hypothetical protein D5086_000308 [Populus alba]|uniref:Uncharacterized protein n=1 Tax=Populus alba TaxID=43335 RepID=A0ACC4CWQ9_POPAL
MMGVSQMERLGIGSNRFSKMVVSFLIAFFLLYMLSLAYRSSTFDRIGEFARAHVTGEMAGNVSRASESEGKHSSHPERVVVDKLLGGLLAPGFDEESCISRYQSSLCRRISPHKPSSYLASKLRKYEELHKRCGPHTESYNRTLEELSSSHVNGTADCNYVVWTPANGLGNRIISTASSFLYALLTNRVLLVDLGTDMANVFCEPFPNTSWLLPMDFPLSNQFYGLRSGNAQSYGQLLKNSNMNISTVSQPPPFLYLYLSFNNDEYDKLFYKDQNQGLHEEKLGLIISKKFKTILVSCLIFLPAALLVLWMRHSTFDLVVEFSESNVQGKVHNVTEIDAGTSHTCIARRRPISPLPISFRNYEQLPKCCGPYTKSYNRTIKRLKSMHSGSTICKYVVWIPANGLGNRMLSMVATFLYALLTNRVLLVKHEAHMTGILVLRFEAMDFAKTREGKSNEPYQWSHAVIILQDLIVRQASKSMLLLLFLASCIVRTGRTGDFSSPSTTVFVLTPSLHRLSQFKPEESTGTFATSLSCYLLLPQPPSRRHLEFENNKLAQTHSDFLFFVYQFFAAMATDQRKRTMDALERRFAVAKAELVQQQQKKHKVTHHEGHRKENNNAASTSLHRADAPKTTSSSLSKKGSSFFFGYTPSQDPDENGLAYSQLPQAVHENLLTTGAKFESKKGSVVDKILHELFQHGDASQKYMQGSRNIKIDNWILLDNYVPSKTTGSQTRASQSNPKHSRRHMSMKQRKKLGMFNLPQDLQKFDVYKPMHEIWKDYMMQLLKKTGRNELPKCLLSADLHGAAILVADCKIKSFTGISGIMICETAETFGIITQDNKLKGDLFITPHLNLVYLTLLCPKSCPFLYFKLIAGRSQCLGTNSLQETQSCDLHIAHFISALGLPLSVAQGRRNIEAMDFVYRKTGVGAIIPRNVFGGATMDATPNERPEADRRDGHGAGRNQVATGPHVVEPKEFSRRCLGCSQQLMPQRSSLPSSKLQPTFLFFLS